MNILIVSANPEERAWYEEHIHMLGHDVQACTTGNVALENCQRNFFPLIIFDVHLSGLTAEELCRHVRLLPQEKRSMLLALVGAEQIPRLQHLLDAGIDDYLLKPVDSSHLMMRISIMERRVRHEHAMEILRMAQTYAGNIVESSLDMIIAVDLKRHIVEFNKAAQQAFGYRLEEVLGKHVDILYADTDKAAVISQTTLDNGRCVQEIINRRKNGEHFPCLLSASILHDMYGTPMGIMGISRDITEYKHAEEKLKQAHDELASQHQALAKASKLKDDFLSLISHELRTPLTVILSQAELLKERLYGGLNDPQRHAIESIEYNGQHLLTLINDMLDFSQITHGHFELTMVPIDVEELCQACLETIRPQADVRQISVSYTYDQHVGYILADERLLKQALLQLLNNAVKFTPQKGKAGLEIQGDSAQQIVHMSVWDTGIGIAGKDMERLFQPFVQLDARLSREYVGAGFGLALTKHIVTLHGGKIDVESTVGEGSRFCITLPWKHSSDIHESAPDHVPTQNPDSGASLSE
jgi:PAS domain S-box-containing protein